MFILMIFLAYISRVAMDGTAGESSIQQTIIRKIQQLPITTF